MESPVRSVETSAGSGEKGEESAGAKGEPPASHRFEAKSYLERQVEELSCADEDEAQEKVSKRLQLKQERAKKKRDIQLQRRRKGITERLRKIREAREAVDARFAENAAQLMERQEEKQTSATRRRRTSLENIKKARAVHNRRVNQRRRESFDDSSGLSPARLKSMDEIHSKLERAERNRDNLRRERRRRAIERYQEGKARALLHGASSSSMGGGLRAGDGGGGGSGFASVSVEAGRYSRRRRTAEARQAAKARQMQRMRDLRQRLLSRDSRELEGKMRVLAAKLLQRWWRCVSKGEPFDSANQSVSLPPDATPSRQRSPKESPEAWAMAQGLELSLPEGLRSTGVTGDATTGPSQGERSPLDPCTRSPLPTYKKFSTGVGPEGRAMNTCEASGVCGNGGGGGGGAAIDATHEPASPAVTGYGFGSNHHAALTIQSFVRRNLHSLKVANALLAGRLSVKVLCTAVRTMSTSTFDEAIDVMSTRAIVSHCETALKALRMGREMRSVPQTVRSARAFLSALLVNFFPSSALDDEGALSSSPEGTAPLQLEKDRLVRAAGKAVQALVDLETTVDTAAATVAAATTAGCDSSGGDARSGGTALTTLGAEQFAKIRRASSTMVRARVAFCRRFAEWKRKDAMRLADEMTAASVDVLLMQLQAERDLHVAAVRYGLDETDDEGALFSTGYEQIKHGTQRQLGKMMHALGKLVGTEEARRRMNSATEAAFERFRAEELAEDEAFLRAAHAASIADEGMGMGMGTDMEDNKRGPKAGKSVKSARTSTGAASAATVAEAKAGETPGESSKTCAESVDAAVQAGKTAGDEEEEDDIAGPRRPLSAGDLLGNEWLVHEVMISEEPLTVSLEEAIENQLLRSGNPAAASADAADKEGRNAYWERVERHVAAEDYTPLLGLVAELRDKIIGLTPRRRDLAAETTEAMDVELLEQMMDYGAFDIGCFFRMIAFAGERVLELEAPIRNEGTKETLAGWGRTQGEVEGGGRLLEPAMVRECFEYLFSKTDEIHVDILNAHLQFVTPFLKQHGVEYERDRFTEKLDAGEISLDMTHLWLHRAIRQLRAAADVASPAPSPAPAGSPSLPVAARSCSISPQPSSVVSQDVLFYRQLLSDLEQKRGDAYLKLLRVAIVDNLLGAIVRVERNKSGSRSAAVGDSGGVSVADAMKTGGEASTVTERDDQQEDMLEGVAVPETLALDRYRLVVIAAGAEQAAYTASLVAFARQALAAARVQLARADENRVRKALMVLFETEDVTSADICAQVAEMTRLIAVSVERALPYNQLSMLSARSRNVLTTGDCPVYKLFLRRTLALLRHTLVEGGLPEDRFEEALRKAGLSDYKEFLLDRVVRPLMVVQRHSEAVFATFYNEIIPLALRTTHAKTLDVD